MDQPIESGSVPSTEVASNLKRRRAFQEVSFNKLPSSGFSVELFAATAVEVHLPPLPPLEARLSSSSFSPDVVQSEVDENVLSTSAFASSAIVPPFVIWRNSSFATLEMLARAAAVAARRGESFGNVQNVHSNNTESLESVRSGAPGDISAADKSLILDQMLVHLARPLLCTTSAIRPARVLVLGDSHSIIFLDAASHYHNSGNSNANSVSLDTDVCSLSNYQACTSFGATAHGLGNATSSVCPFIPYPCITF